jgi:hypothetical protein
VKIVPGLRYCAFLSIPSGRGDFERSFWATWENSGEMLASAIRKRFGSPSPLGRNQVGGMKCQIDSTMLGCENEATSYSNSAVQYAFNIMDVEQDIIEQLRADFPAAEVESRLQQLAQASEVARIQRCIVFASRGHPWYFDYLRELTKVDFRDVIMAGEYDRLGARLYDFNRRISEARIDDPCR